MTEDQKDLHIEMLLAENKTQALILKSLESSLADFIKLNEKLRNSILKNPFSCHEIYEKVIKDFILYCGSNDANKLVMLNDTIYQCGTKSHGVECLFNKIITKYKMDKANENN